MAGDVVYKSELDDKDVLAALKRINQSIDKIADQGGRSFDKLGKSAGSSGLQIGAVSGVVQELTRRFIDLGERAAEAFAQAVAGGIKLNEQAENITIALTAIFGGNQDAAEAFLDVIDETAKRLGTNRQELRAFAKSILPEVGDIDRVAKLAEQAKLLAADAGVSTESARIAFEEALSGNLNSLQRRLNIGGKYIDQIRAEADRTGDLAAALETVLGSKIEDSGLSIENFADSFSIAIGKAQATLLDLQELLGKAGFEEAKNQINELLAAFERNRGDIENVTAAFGDLAAKVLEIVGSGIVEFLDSADFEAFENLADNLTVTLDTAQLLIDVLGTPDALGGLIDDSNSLLETLQKALVTAAQIGTLAKAEQARRQAELEFLLGDTPQGTKDLLSNLPIANLVSKASVSDNRRAEAERIGQEAYNQAIKDALPAFDEYNDKLAESAEQHDKRRESVEKDTTAGKEAGEAYLAQKRALEDLQNAENDAAEARKAIDEKLAKARIDAARDLTDALIKFSRQELDAAIKNAQKREDLALKNAQKIADIFRRNQFRLADAQTDLNRDEQDILRDAARETEKTEQESADRKVEIERNYRLELQRIRDQFNQSAQEAERNNDAQAFIAAIRTRDSQVEEAKRSRQEDIDSAKIDASQKRDEAKRSLEYELEDARIANARKVEDLQKSLERELEEQRIAYERDLAEQTTAEQRQAEQRRMSQQQELEDIRRHQAQKLADLQQSLQAEYELVVEYEKKKAAFAINAAIELQKRIRQFTGAGSTTPTRTVAPTGTTAPSANRRQSRHIGGPVAGGQSYAMLPGEMLVTPGSNGYVVPGPATVGAGYSTSINNSRTIENVNVPGSLANDPMLARMVRNMVQSEILASLE